MDSFNTIKKAVASEIIKIKKSKFLGFAYPIKNEQDAQEKLIELKKKHPNASHYCYAWQLGNTNENYRTNDDGEPNNSAGKPIYGQILANDLTDVFVVVIRYYGGTKLGVGGLISAYKECAAATLKASTIIQKTINVTLKLSFNYDSMNSVMRTIKRHDLTILNQSHNMRCEVEISVRKNLKKKVVNEFLQLRDVNCIAL